MQVVLGRKSLLGLVVVAGAAVGAWALAGNLTPPTGPVAPTMKTLDEVFAAAASPGGCNANCTTGLGGTVGMLGSCVMPGLPASMPNPTFQVIKFSQNVNKPLVPSGGGGGSANSTVGDFVLTKPLDRTSVGLYRALTAGTTFASATVTMLDAAGTPVMNVQLKNCVVTDRTIGMEYRCDGSTVMAETISINSTLVRYTDMITNQFWEYNFATQAGTGN